MYKRFKLSVINEDFVDDYVYVDESEICENLSKISNKIIDSFECESLDNGKWKNFESDMLKLSKKYPNLYFNLQKYFDYSLSTYNVIGNDYIFHNGKYDFKHITINIPSIIDKKSFDLS